MLAAQVEPKNETTKKCEKQRNHSLTRKAPYKPEQASKVTMRMPTLLPFGEGRVSGEAIDICTRSIRRGSGHGTSERWFGQSGETRHGEGSGLNVATGGGQDGSRTGS